MKRKFFLVLQTEAPTRIAKRRTVVTPWFCATGDKETLQFRKFQNMGTKYCRICGYRLAFEHGETTKKLQPMKYVLVVVLSLVMKIAP